MRLLVCVCEYMSEFTQTKTSELLKIEQIKNSKTRVMWHVCVRQCACVSVKSREMKKRRHHN